MLGHCKTSNFFIPVFTTQVAWELQRIMVGQWYLHDTSFHILLDDDKHGGVVLSAPFFLNIYRSVLTLSFLSLIISCCWSQILFSIDGWNVVFSLHTTKYKLIGIYFSGYLQSIICRHIFRTEGLKLRSSARLWKITEAMEMDFKVYIICCMQLMSKRRNFMVFPF